MKVLFSTNQQDVIEAEAQICQNAGIPNDKGTTKWSDITEYDGGYFIVCPGDSGWGGFTKEQMLQGVSLEERDISISSELSND